MNFSTDAMGCSSSQTPPKIPGQIFLWIAVSIFAASGAVAHRLTELGAQHPVGGHNPISFCNVLFVGNLCALLVMIPIHRKDLTPTVFKRLTRQDWLAMLAVAVLAGALAPALFLLALTLTLVNNVTLVSRIEPLLTLLLSVWLLRERVTGLEVFGAIVSFLGVLVTVALQGVAGGGMGFLVTGDTGRAELMTAIAAIALAVANVISRSRLANLPTGTFGVVRTALGTVIFFCNALGLYGPQHFAEAFSPFLWQWMLLYGTLIVVVGQSSWLIGLKRTSASEASLVEAFNPIGAVVAAYLILAEAPTMAQWVGGAVIVAGLALSLFGTYRRSQEAQPTGGTAQMTVASSSFRGM